MLLFSFDQALLFFLQSKRTFPPTKLQYRIKICSLENRYVLLKTYLFLYLYLLSSFQKIQAEQKGNKRKFVYLISLHDIKYGYLHF